MKLKQILWMVVAAILLLLAILVELTEAVPEGAIHIRLVEGHAITTPDVIAVVLLLESVLSAGVSLWPWRQRFLAYIREHPVAAGILLIALGIAAGFLMGLLTGARFANGVRNIARQIMSPINFAYRFVQHALGAR